MHESPKVAFFDKIATYFIIATLALLPIIFIPFIGIGTEITKSFILGFGVLVALVMWTIARLIQGSIVYPKSPAALSVFLIPLVFFVSALFSPVFKISVAGTYLSLGTAVMMLIFALLFFGGVIYLNTEAKIKKTFTLLTASFGIVSLFQILYILFGARFLNLGVFFSSSSNLIGKWNDFAIGFGLVSIAILCAFELLDLSRLAKIVLRILLTLSLVFLALVNFMPVWVLLGLFSLIIFVYSLTILRRDGEESRYHFPIAPFVALLVALMFIIANSVVGGVLARYTGVYQTEIRPSIPASASVTWQVIKDHPLLGVGPDRFDTAWLLYHPKDITNTQFWDTSFSSGFSLIPSFIVTTGILGIVAFLIFLSLFLLSGFLHAFKTGLSRNTHFYVLSTFLLGLYAWICAFIYNPGIVPFAFAFAFSGMFIGTLNTLGRIPVKTIKFLEDPRQSFFAILVLVLLLVGSLSLVFVGGQKFTSLVLYSQAQKALAQNNVDKAGQLISQAINLEESDTYYQGLTTLALNRLSLLLKNDKLSEDIVKSEFQNIFGAAEDSARKALAYDRTNPQNWITLGGVYQAVVPLKITGAYDNAKNAYEEARKLSPENPGFDLIRARLEVDQKDNKTARKFVADALSKKPNYIDAIFLLAQIEIADGNTQNAINQIEQAALIDPRNPSVFFQLGLLKYNNTDYQGAISAFERSATLDATGVNVRYFLALAYEKVGRIEDEKNLFASLAKALPDNENLQKIMANLEVGKPALDGLVATVPTESTEISDKSPLNGKELPLKEKTK